MRRLCFYRHLSVHGGGWGGVGVSASVHAGIPHPPTPRDQVHPWEQTPPGADTPLEQTPPGSRHPPGADTPSPRDTATAADGTHPTGMHSCLKRLCLTYAGCNSWGSCEVCCGSFWTIITVIFETIKHAIKSYINLNGFSCCVDICISAFF